MKDCQEADNLLPNVRRIVRETLEGTSLRAHVARFGSTVGGGKMLRARLILRVGAAVGVAEEELASGPGVQEAWHVYGRDVMRPQIARFRLTAAEVIA